MHCSVNESTLIEKNSWLLSSKEVEMMLGTPNEFLGVFEYLIEN
jgi:hypothetical protein